MRERDKPAPRQRFRQQQGYGPVVEDAAGQGHGADAAAPRPGKRQIGKPFRQSKVKPAGQIGDRNACPPQFQQVQKKGCRPERRSTNVPRVPQIVSAGKIKGRTMKVRPFPYSASCR